MCKENKLRYTWLHQKLILTRNLTPTKWKEYRDLEKDIIGGEFDNE